jgi:hypothetical protein
MRFQVELERGPGLIPNTIVVTCGHAKSIRSRRKVCVVSGSPCPGIDPFFVETLQLVFEIDLFRCQ